MADHSDAALLKPFDASEYHIGIAVGLFNSHITSPMLQTAVQTLLKDYQVPQDHIHTIEVPGAADMPAALEALARKDEIDCLLTIAAIIKGETAHFDYVAKVVTEGVKDVQIKHAKAVGFGVLTVNTGEQAQARIPHAADYAAAALHVARNIKNVH